MEQPILQVNQLVKQYSNTATNAVDGIDFQVYSGELFCLLGVNGAGKSTTINMICTLLEKTSGSVRLNNLTLGKDDHEIRQSIGVVFQGNILDDVLSAGENIISRGAFYGLDKDSAKKRLDYLAKRLSMTEFLDSRYGRLSGGQRRKCDIARALIGKPEILFLDEPTTGLDPQSRIELWDTIEEIRRESQMTVFLTTHYMEETEHSDRVAIMDHGKILVMDTPQRLKTKYSTDILRLVVRSGCQDGLEKHLKEYNKDYQQVADTYIVKMKNGIEAIDFLPKVKPYLDSFEMEKGNMDNVFLNVVGRSVNE
jgi:multidrug/hemolysin transport system ATP-binding protein